MEAKTGGRNDRRYITSNGEDACFYSQFPLAAWLSRKRISVVYKFVVLGEIFFFG